METETHGIDGPRLHSRTWLAATALALIPYLVLVARFDWLCDDALISFRYSRHLAEGHGLRFNLGESPPVEGYSNLLWVLVLAPFELARVDLALASRALTILSGAALLALVARFAAQRLALGFAGTLSAALFLAVLPTIPVWSTSGLETLPFALCVFGLFERLTAHESEPPERRSRPLGAVVWAMLAALLRADGALWAGVVLALVALVPDASRSARRRAVAGPAIGLVLTVAAHVAWRRLYHGDVLPNTAYAKAGFSSLRLERGLEYVVSYFLSVPAFALAPLAALATRGRPRPMLALRCGLVMLFSCAYALYLGGDFMAMGRLLAPAMAFAAVLLALALRGLACEGRTGRPAAAVLACASILLALLASFDLPLVPRGWRERFHFRWDNPARLSEIEQWRAMKERMATWDRVARALALHTRPGESIVFGAVGAVGYRTELVLHDPLGLVSPEVARRAVVPARASPGHDLRVPPEFFLFREPDYLDAFVVQRTLPLEAGVRPEWRRAAWFQRLQVERRPLSSEQGFPPDVELRLLRLDWSE